MKRSRSWEGEETTLACDGSQQAFFGRVGAFLGRAFGFFAFEDAEFPFEAGFFSFASSFSIIGAAGSAGAGLTAAVALAALTRQRRPIRTTGATIETSQARRVRFELAAGVFGAVGHHSRHRPGVMLA